MNNFLGKPIIYHVIKNALEFLFLNKIVVSTDSQEIYDYVVKTFVGVDVVDSGKTSCGSERVFRYYSKVKSYDYYVSIASDEPCIDSNEVNYVVADINFEEDKVSTFYTDFYSEEDLVSHLSCKIVIYNNMMIYNSRSVIPIRKNGKLLDLSEYNKHVGIFVFPNKLLKEKGLSIWENKSDIESLEQNRFIEGNIPVRMYKMKHIGFGIDSPDQIIALEKRMDEKDNRVNHDE